ncbi:biliverdin-producing heme oxygenase [Larkinella insperata]|uniref:Biliverdin-producing heme oxygenase n=1 Tax=Larkinella insperata TaxID=332158 RepID=A0ABW3QBS3_9BACT|nr:biliverdin-producing heme oxygenase [Larkinella insperata]
MTLAERLRYETRAVHEETEELLYTESLKAGQLSLEQYSHLLRVHWLFHYALEATIDRYPAFFQAYHPNERRKTPWLTADLAELNIPLPDPQSDLFADWSPVELLGAAYVGEGSMLGGKVVFHHLQKSPELKPVLQNARFYRGYGAEALEKWKAFGGILAGQPEVEHDKIVQAAHRTFRAYHDIFKHTQRQDQPVA